MVINLNSFNSRVQRYRKECTYRHVLRNLREGREKNPARKDAFNLLIFDLKKKNPHLDEESVDGQNSTARTLFTEETSDGHSV